ncbi:MAG: hypothetical protein GX757_05145 [Clostridiales bacterium]|nr:hypothetical protein [Clostridiales bacterium]
MADQDVLHTAEIMKAALPYIDAHNKIMVELIMKVLELVGFFRTFRKSLSLAACGYEAGKIDLEGMLNNIKPVCNKKERDFIDKILNIFNIKRAMEMYNQMMEVMNVMQQDSQDYSFDASNYDFSSSDAADSATSSSDEISALLDYYKSAPESADIDDADANDNEKGLKTDENIISDSAGSNQSDKSTSSGLINEKMLDMLKAIVPPEQRSTFDNLSMLLSSMSYDNTSNADEDKERNN